MTPACFDTHVHFSSADEILVLVDRAVAAGVRRMVAVGASPVMNTLALAAAHDHPGVVVAALGHDREAAGAVDATTACLELKQQIESARAGGVRVVALGEIGLDFHYHPDLRDAQLALFRAELALARELKLPVIVHSREADGDTVAALCEHAAAWDAGLGPVGVLHCFTGGQAFAEKILDLGFFMSFSGILTFRNADPLRAVAAQVPPDRLLVETDTPYLAPVPIRGQRNEPAFVRHVVACLAQVRHAAVDEMAALTYANAERMFGVC
jgi:TatD DNase family protein